VSARVELVTGDMTAMPFEAESFDLVLSSLAIHNVRDPDGRLKAIDEAARVLKPGGRLIIADIAATGEYVRRLNELGMGEITSRPLGWRFWYGGPWVATRLVTAMKPGRRPL
jgi:arsenite methyltransferase